ncbi:hypothetical protein GCK72_000707 [Caenorhabditis remanei]|uniref:Uncharacterized protein n=2 Tax=Caenorhabditis remanei TaxID=31234 RepID=A0A6A5HQK5_CAERE|nr:hypothetical protein GCK72_000707 [Caenorhabditis remanei]KAF1768894.1 hypothetical protein GCK72_000707 [Caenorhabditis remanei]
MSLQMVDLRERVHTLFDAMNRRVDEIGNESKFDKKHELLSRWPQHERHVELLERQNYLEQEIAKLEWNSDDDFSIVTERM